MASTPAPTVTINGQVRRIERFEQIENRETGESRQAARVQILTDRGGFAEVYIGPDHVGVLPADADGIDIDPFTVSWLITAAAWQRDAWGQQDVPPAQRRRYAELRLSFVRDQAAGAGAGSRPLSVAS